jgi:hypothetical protein
MYPVKKNNNSRPNEYSDSVRAFGLAIRDPESFLHYLRQEESQRLGKKNWTMYNHELPKSRFVQMQILSQSDSKEKIPVLDMVVEQDDKMDTHSFMDFMKQLSVLPAYNTRRSTSSGRYASALELQRQQKKILVPQYTLEQNYKVQMYKHYGNNLSKQRLNQRKINHEKEREVTPSDSEVELECGQKEQPQIKENMKQRERNYHQMAEVAEPSSVIGKFGQRNSNSSRPSAPEFNNSKSRGIIITPSQHILHTPVSIFRHFSPTQNVSTFKETPVPKSHKISTSRVRKEPLTSNSTRPIVSILATATGPPFTYSLRVYSEINPKTTDISLVSTDISRMSRDINTDTDISHVHIDIPRIYTGISRPHDVSTPSSDISHILPFTEISRAHFAVPRQHPNPSLSPASFQSAKDRDHLESSSALNVSALSRELTTVSHQSFQSVDSFPQSADISPLSADIIPPLLPLFTKKPTSTEQLQLPEESEGHEEIFVTNTPPYNSRQNEKLSGSGDVNKQESNSYSASSLQQSADPVARNIKNVYPSLIATTEQKESGEGKVYNPSTKAGDKKQMRRKSIQQPVISRIHEEDKYNEVHLTVAETAYYKRRQLARKPFMILETAGE